MYVALHPRLAQLGTLAGQWLVVQGALKCRVQLLGRGSPWQGPRGLLQQGGCRCSQRGTESEPQPSAGLAPVSLLVEDLSAPFYRRETEAHGEGALGCATPAPRLDAEMAGGGGGEVKTWMDEKWERRDVGP